MIEHFLVYYIGENLTPILLIVISMVIFFKTAGRHK